MPSGTHNGWYWDRTNGRLAFYYRGTQNGYLTGTVLSTQGLAPTTTMTAGTGWTDTTGNTTNAAGDMRCTAGNLRLGVVSAFATTEPTSAAVLKTGTAPAGAITTSCAIFASSTVLRKIIAASTVSDIQS